MAMMRALEIQGPPAGEPKIKIEAVISRTDRMNVPAHAVDIADLADGCLFAVALLLPYPSFDGFRLSSGSLLRTPEECLTDFAKFFPASQIARPGSDQIVYYPI
jgi:hypothetical protein